DEARARRLLDGFGKRAIFLAVGADELGDPVQMILRLLAVALLDLPQAIILPGLDVVRIGFQRALVPDLRELVVAELAIGVTDQIGDGGAVIVTERLQLRDRRRVVVVVIDRCIGGAIAVRERCVFSAGRRFAGFLFLALGGRRRRVAVGRGIDAGNH